MRESRELEIVIEKPDPNTFLLTKLQQMWHNNKCCFVIGMSLISAVVILIILGVVILIVVPALPQIKST
jgi:type II secretory pathway pseudopilin PulG